MADNLSQCEILTKVFVFSILDNKSLVDSIDSFIFHSPYCKLVQKSFARLMLNDFWDDPDPDFANRYRGLEKYR